MKEKLHISPLQKHPTPVAAVDRLCHNLELVHLPSTVFATTWTLFTCRRLSLPQLGTCSPAVDPAMKKVIQNEAYGRYPSRWRVFEFHSTPKACPITASLCSTLFFMVRNWARSVAISHLLEVWAKMMKLTAGPTTSCSFRILHSFVLSDYTTFSIQNKKLWLAFECWNWTSVIVHVNSSSTLFCLVIITNYILTLFSPRSI
jgi:hypothetical protein